MGLGNPNLIHGIQLRKVATQAFQLGCNRSVINVPLIALKHQGSLVGFRFRKFRKLILQRGSNG